MTRLLRLRAFGDPQCSVELVEVPEPEPAPGEVVVALEAASINPSDLRLISGSYGVRPPLPAPLGTEGVGRVLGVGDGVEPELVGERVVVVPGHAHGTWASRAVIARDNVIPVSAESDARQLAMAGVNPVTALLLLRAGGELAPGDWVAQTGANSAVGQHVARLARMTGVRTFNVVRRPDATAVVRDAGGDVVVLADGPLAEDLRASLGGRRFALVLDSVGGPVVTELTHHLRDGGTVVSYGAISGEGVALSVRDDVIYRGISHHGFWIVNWLRDAPRHEIESTYRQIVDHVAAGRLSATLDRSYPLGEYRRALARAGQYRRPGKVLFAPGRP